MPLAFLLFGCQSNDGKPVIDVEAGTWRVSNCTPPTAQHRDFCHMLLCEAELHNRRVVAKEANLVQMTQQFSKDGESIQEATFLEGSVQRFATCEIKDMKVTFVKMRGDN